MIHRKICNGMAIKSGDTIILPKESKFIKWLNSRIQGLNREVVPKNEEPVKEHWNTTLNCQMWRIKGTSDIITDFSLTQQRMYHQHENGEWSRPKDHSSSTSLDVE